MIRPPEPAHARPGRRPRAAPGPHLVLLALITAGCETPLALQPRGPAAHSIAGLGWALLITATIVSLIVFLLLFLALRRGAGAERSRPSEGAAARFVLIGGAVIPAVILTGFTYATLAGLSAFDRGPDADHVVTVRAHQFWWEIEYPEAGVTTANELHLPAGESVRVELESDDVIHSFWVPELHGKIEAVPGRVNVLHLEADEPGTYLGRCAEFCGSQHARMEVRVIALEPDAYAAWLEGQRAPAAEPAGEEARRGRDVFVGSPCAQCHTIRGVSHAVTTAAPDLTHLASRATLAAGTLPNTRGHLGGWIADPQGIKPGAEMPAVRLESDDFRALLDYLTGLE